MYGVIQIPQPANDLEPEFLDFYERSELFHSTPVHVAMHKRPRRRLNSLGSPVNFIFPKVLRRVI